MILPLTLIIAGAAAILNIWIAARIGKVRVSEKIMIGDGGNQTLAARMRAHSNFVEYTPFFLILLALVELAAGQPLWLWAVAILFILARIIHVFGMDRPGANPLRGAGAAISALILAGLALYAIYLGYSQQLKPKPAITYAEAARAST